MHGIKSWLNEMSESQSQERRKDYQLLHLCIAGNCLNDAVRYIEKGIPFNIHLTEICLTVMKWWVADDLEVSESQDT